jgi:3-deoxy-D-manno-octulosonic-acid transferase
VAATTAAPGLRLLLRVRQARGKEIPGRLPERRGIDATPRPPGRLIWLHAASVGETMSILPVLPPLAEAAPTVLLTTCTVTSATLLAQRLDPALAGRVLHRFAPLDVPAWVARFLDHWRPDAAGFVESELWPNLLAACRVRQVPAMLINGRLSERSLARWRRVPRLAQHVLGEFASVRPRSETDAERLRALGCSRMSEPGDLKLAAPPLPVDEMELRRLRELLTGRPVWFVASTHPGEETLILAAHRILAAEHPLLLTIIAPRHPERGTTIPAAAYRSRGDGPPRKGVWVADTLASWLRYGWPTSLCRLELAPLAAGKTLWSRHVLLRHRRRPLHQQLHRPRRDVALPAAGGGAGRSSSHWVDGLLRDPGALDDAKPPSMRCGVKPTCPSVRRRIAELLA